VILKIAKWNKFNISNSSLTSSIDCLNDAKHKISTISFKNLKTPETDLKSFSPISYKEVKNEKSTHGCMQVLRSRRFLVIFMICSFGW